MHGRLTLCGFGCNTFGGALVPPELPISLCHLSLDGSAFSVPGPPWNPPSDLRLSDLTRLETLTLLGCVARALEDEFLGDCEQPPLPSSLRTLRLESPARWPQRVNLSRYWAPRLSASADLTFETSVGQVDCGIGLREDSEVSCMTITPAATMAEDGTPQATSLLPAGVRSLSLEMGAIQVSDARLSATLDPESVCQDDAMRSLCLLFSSAPDSYREFRLSNCGSPRRVMRVHLTWFSATLDRAVVKTFRPKNMASLADMLRRFAPAYGMSVSLSADESCCVVQRLA